MDIRCKRCFKKYDDSFPLCPRCGKQSEYKVGSSYNQSTKRHDSNSKSEEPSFAKKIIESYDTNNSGVNEEAKLEIENDYSGEVTDDKIDEIWSYIANGFYSIFKPLIKYRYCEFCGSKSRSSDYFCHECKSGFKGNYYDSKLEFNVEHKIGIGQTIKDFIATQNGHVDSNVFIKTLNSQKFDFTTWNHDGEFKTGIRKSKLVAMAMYTAFSFWMLFMISSAQKPSTPIMVWFILLLITGNLFAIPLSKKFFTESITINNLYISVNNNRSRSQMELYGAKPENIKGIELIYDSNMAIENIIFRSKKGSEVSNLVFSLSVSLYANRESLVNYIILFACKNNISLYVSREEAVDEYISEDTRLEDSIVEGKINFIKEKDDYIKEENSKKDKKEELETLFVRIDRKVEGKTLTELEFASHLAYLEKISKKEYFMGGGFKEESGGMIIFSAIDLIDANEISKEDPIIKCGAYTYELKEWNIVIKSNKNNIV